MSEQIRARIASAAALNRVQDARRAPGEGANGLSIQSAVPDWVDREMLAKDIYYRERKYVLDNLFDEEDSRAEERTVELADFVYTQVIERVHLGWTYLYGMIVDPRDPSRLDEVRSIEKNRVKRHAEMIWPDAPDEGETWRDPARTRQAAVNHVAEWLEKLAFAIPGDGKFEHTFFEPAMEDADARRAELIEHWASERAYWLNPAQLERWAWERSIAGGSDAS